MVNDFQLRRLRSQAQNVLERAPTGVLLPLDAAQDLTDRAIMGMVIYISRCGGSEHSDLIYDGTDDCEGKMLTRT
jgi:hypothetical protein